MSTCTALLRGASDEHSCSHVTGQPTGGRRTVTYNFLSLSLSLSLYLSLSLSLSLLAADQHDVSSYGSPSSAITFAADGYDVSSSVSFFVLRVHLTTWVIVVERSYPLFELFALS